MSEATKLVPLPDGKTPLWWSMKGSKMQAGPPSLQHLNLAIANGRVAVVDILWHPDGWKVGWKITHSPGWVAGGVRMSEVELKVAFGLATIIPNQDLWFAERFSADAGAEGLFLREGRHLSIPGPGTALFGDPNIAVFVTDDIRIAVAKLIGYALRQ